jgi:MoaA/NifB/PqqE/SkfB family radical SAM enzyme
MDAPRIAGPGSFPEDPALPPPARRSRLRRLGQLARLAADCAGAALALRGLRPAPAPINVTFSVTNRCQSRCRTCNIWNLYRDEPEKAQTELTLPEIERVFRSMPPTFFFNVSGGEPFLRDDLPQIVELAAIHLRPAVVHVPTNGLAVEKVLRGTVAILESLRRVAPGTTLTLKPSLDGLGPDHDELRGVPGNFDRVRELLAALVPLRARHPELHVGLGTVVSAFNAERLQEIAGFVEAIDVDSYISEVAGVRSEMFNTRGGITPDADRYERAMVGFRRSTLALLRERRGLARLTLAFRLQYYELAVRILRERRQVVPCHAGLTNVHLSAYGDVWPCCVRGYEGSFGNLRDHGHDFGAIWRSTRAGEVRASIRQGHCACPLANQAYANLLLSPAALRGVARTLLAPAAP